MSNINQINNSTPFTPSVTTPSSVVGANVKNLPPSGKDEVIYESSTKNFMPDIDKIKSMKAENDQRMIDLLMDTTSKSFLKQLGGLRGVLERVLKGEKVEGVDLAFSAKDIEQAKIDIAPGGYWSPEKTSDRLLEFAKALSGDDPSKADQLMNAVKKGFGEAAKIWGGTLPDISQQTYDLTMKKFDDWANSTKTI